VGTLSTPTGSPTKDESRRGATLTTLTLVEGMDERDMIKKGVSPSILKNGSREVDLEMGETGRPIPPDVVAWAAAKEKASGKRSFELKKPISPWREVTYDSSGDYPQSNQIYRVVLNDRLDAIGQTMPTTETESSVKNTSSPIGHALPGSIELAQTPVDEPMSQNKLDGPLGLVRQSSRKSVHWQEEAEVIVDESIGLERAQMTYDSDDEEDDKDEDEDELDPEEPEEEVLDEKVFQMKFEAMKTLGHERCDSGLGGRSFDELRESELSREYFFNEDYDDNAGMWSDVNHHGEQDLQEIDISPSKGRSLFNLTLYTHRNLAFDSPPSPIQCVESTPLLSPAFTHSTGSYTFSPLRLDRFPSPPSSAPPSPHASSRSGSVVEVFEPLPDRSIEAMLNKILSGGRTEADSDENEELSVSDFLLFPNSLSLGSIKKAFIPTETNAFRLFPTASDLVSDQLQEQKPVSEISKATISALPLASVSTTVTSAHLEVENPIEAVSRIFSEKVICDEEDRDQHTVQKIPLLNMADSHSSIVSVDPQSPDHVERFHLFPLSSPFSFNPLHTLHCLDISQPTATVDYSDTCCSPTSTEASFATAASCIFDSPMTFALSPTDLDLAFYSPQSDDMFYSPMNSPVGEGDFEDFEDFLDEQDEADRQEALDEIEMYFWDL
jgi:hypothetical protein